MEGVQALGVDLGFCNSKGVNSRGWEPVFPSLVGSPDEALFSLNGNGDILLELPYPARVGAGVVDQSLWEVRRQDRGWWQSREWKTLLLAMLSELHGTSAEAVLTLGWPASWYGDRVAIRESLMGEHVVKRPGRGRQAFDLVDVRILPQGLGLYADMVFDDDGQVKEQALFNARVGVVNVGSNNTALLDVQKMRVGSGSLSVELGSWMAVESLRRVLSVKVPGLRIRDHQVDEVLRAGFVMRGPEKVDVSMDVAEIKDEFGRAVVAKMSQAWGDGQQFQMILVGGGSVYHVDKLISEKYPHAVCHPRPVTGDAWGYWKFSRRVAAARKE